jgi:hypothetical protein
VIQHTAAEGEQVMEGRARWRRQRARAGAGAQLGEGHHLDPGGRADRGGEADLGDALRDSMSVSDHQQSAAYLEHLPVRL